MDVKLIVNIAFWTLLVAVGLPIFGSPAGLFGEYWFWWPTEAKAQVVNALAMFGLGAFAIGGWTAISKPDKTSMTAAWVGLFLIAFGYGFATVDCNYLFRCA